VLIASRAEVVKNAGGQMYAKKLSHEIKGVLTGSTSDEITQEMNSLMTALAKPFQDFIFYQDDGTESATHLKNANSISGVTVDGPNFTESRGAQYVNQRDFSFTVTAEYPLNNTSNLLMRFQETLTFAGGGPRFVVREAITGLPQKQQVAEFTVYETIQEGMAEGYLKEPAVPPAIWPAALLHAPVIRRTSPDKKGKGYERFGVTWRYSFASPTPLTGTPNLWL
jgi:hypothetical protein